MTIAKAYESSTQAFADLEGLYARTQDSRVKGERLRVLSGDKAEREVAWQLEQSVDSDELVILHRLRLDLGSVLVLLIGGGSIPHWFSVNSVATPVPAEKAVSKKPVVKAVGHRVRQGP